MGTGNLLELIRAWMPSLWETVGLAARVACVEGRESELYLGEGEERVARVEREQIVPERVREGKFVRDACGGETGDTTHCWAVAVCMCVSEYVFVCMCV